MRGKIVSANLHRRFRGKPLPPGVLVVADEFFLLGIHRDHGAALRQASFHRGIDVPELRIAVRMVSPLLRLPVALKAVVEAVQKLSDLRMADRMLVPTQLVRNRPRALTNPSQRRFRVALAEGFEIAARQVSFSNTSRALRPDTRQPSGKQGNRFSLPYYSL